MSDINHSPVPLGTGSYDLDELQKRLDKAAKGSAANYDKAVAAALTESVDTVAKDQDPRAIPGYRFVDAKNDLGGVEKVQVYDPKLAEKEGVEPDTSEAEVVNRQAKQRADAVEAAPQE